MKWLLAAALCAPLAAPARAAHPLTPAAPEFPKGAAWLNSRPFRLKELRGRRVVLVSFVNVFNINSIRSLTALNRWWNQYGLNGLMVIGVHTPDYDFDRDPITVRAELKRRRTRFPVLMDSNRAIWKAYANQGWPTHYLVDHRGDIVYDRLGEGGAAEFEREILAALQRFNGYEPPASYRIPPDAPRENCGEATAGVYIGARRGKPVRTIDSDRNQILSKALEGEAFSEGRWTLESDSLRYDGAGENEGRLQVFYRGAEAHAILKPGPKPTRVYVKQDGLWLYASNASADVQWDKEDRSFLSVDAPRLYHVTRGKSDEPHELLFYPASAGPGAAGFEFSDRCQTDYERR